jgi:hypothetical protein
LRSLPINFDIKLILSKWRRIRIIRAAALMADLKMIGGRLFLLIFGIEGFLLIFLGKPEEIK